MIMNMNRHGVSGLVYDGVNLTELLQVKDISLPVLPPVEVITHELPQRAGAYFASRQIKTREFTIQFRLEAETRNPTDIFKEWRNISKVFSKTEPKKLYLNDHKYCNALLIGETTIANEAYYGDVELRFACFDPYFYGETHTETIKAGTALSFPVQGDESTFPTLDLTATTTSVKITNNTTGDYVLIPNTKSGAKVYIDMEHERSTIGGVYAPVDLLSDYFSISGTVSITVTGANGTLSYEERYL